MARAARNRSKTAAQKRQRTPLAPKRGASTPWPTIEEFLASEEGEITLGVIHHSITALHRYRQRRTHHVGGARA